VAAFTLILPFVAAMLGAAAGATLAHFTGLNVYLTTLAFAYVAVLPLLIPLLRISLRARPSHSPPRSEHPAVLLTLIYLSVATCAAVPVLLMVVALKIRKAEEQMGQ